MARCPYGGRDQPEKYLECHKWWIGHEAMNWKRYLQFNHYGPGDVMAWQQDANVCSVADNQVKENKYVCQDPDSSKSAVDSKGNVIDEACPCIVNNPLKFKTREKFSKMGWGRHMMIHVYDVMNPAYVPHDFAPEFEPLEFPYH